MRLASLNEYRRMFFTPESAPALSTLRARINRKEIPGGGREGGRYYVDLDEHDTVTRFSAKLVERQQELSKRPELQGLL